LEAPLSEANFTSFADWWAGRRIATSAAFFLPHLQPGVALLDCGCGPGTITIDFAEILAPKKVIGVDMDDRALDRARKAADERGIRNVRFEHGDIYSLGFADASFDAVWTSSTMQWLHRPRKAISEIRRVLKPGGVYGSRDRATQGDLFGNAKPPRAAQLAASLPSQRTQWTLTDAERETAHAAAGRGLRKHHDVRLL